MNRLHNRIVAMEARADIDLPSALAHFRESLHALDSGLPQPKAPTGLTLDAQRRAMVVVLRQLDEVATRGA